MFSSYHLYINATRKRNNNNTYPSITIQLWFAYGFVTVIWAVVACTLDSESDLYLDIYQYMHTSYNALEWKIIKKINEIDTCVLWVLMLFNVKCEMR